MSVKKIAIYLPQFHAIAENDKAWGEGFTEWTNVKKAQPLFEGHYQPHVPHKEVGYYSLADETVLQRQAALALANGIHGFAYYHYWFNGKRLLQQPLDNMLASDKPAMPFCYIWANENWTKRWDGADQDVIIQQKYSLEDDLAHITFLCKNVFCDKRYICIDGKPLFLVYRTELFPDITETVSCWRNEVKKYGFTDIHLVRIESFVKEVEPATIGFDGAMEFAPDWTCANYPPRMEGNKYLFDYPTTVYNMIVKQRPFKYYHCVFPGWDNTPRRVNWAGMVFINNDPTLFRYFLETQMHSTIEQFSNADQQYIFINAWNEWGEGCHIEPDKKNGMRYLDICREAVPVAPNNFEQFCKHKIDDMQHINDAREKELLLLQQKYSHMINGRYYKTGKKIQAVILAFSNLFYKHK